MEERVNMWILVDVFRCTGCRLCEIACSMHHEKTVWPSASRITVIEPYPGAPVPLVCAQCDDYPCVNSCPYGALRVNEKTGAVVVEESKCTLCGTCKAVCPAGVPRIVPGKGYVLICDLCGGDTQCVKICNEVGYGALKLATKPEGMISKTTLRDPFAKSHVIYRRVILGGSE
ncbi:MAG: 4Fe-4S dicluster domain-containing protein [Desulfurococcaceae archaeon]